MKTTHGPSINKTIQKTAIPTSTGPESRRCPPAGSHIFLTGFLSIFCLGMILVAAGCKNQTGQTQEPVTKDIFAMDTQMSIAAYGDQAQEALDQAEEEIKRLEGLLSTEISTSEIAQLNRKGEGDVSEDTSRLIERAGEIHKDTSGAFDISVYNLMQAWGFPSQNYRVPEEKEIEELMSLLGEDDITVEGNHVTLGKEGMQIDLGAIAKGYAAQRIIDILKEKGVTSALINLGGNVHTLGKKPDGSPWKVAIEDPKKEKEYIGVIETEDKGVVTSGGYERFFEEDGKVYHHIIDPSTGYPADSGLASVTIISGDGSLADGLSTALFVMGKDKAEEFWRGRKDSFDMVLVEDNGDISVTEGIEKNFSVPEGSFSVIR